MFKIIHQEIAIFNIEDVFFKKFLKYNPLLKTKKINRLLITLLKVMCYVNEVLYTDKGNRYCVS